MYQSSKSHPFLFSPHQRWMFIYQRLNCWIYIPLQPSGILIYPLMMQINLLCRSWGGVVGATRCEGWRAGGSEYVITALYNSVTFGKALWSLHLAPDGGGPVERPAGVFSLWCWWWFSFLHSSYVIITFHHKGVLPSHEMYAFEWRYTEHWFIL